MQGYFWRGGKFDGAGEEPCEPVGLFHGFCHIGLWLTFVH